jgi:hypothetical protein
MRWSHPYGLLRFFSFISLSRKNNKHPFDYSTARRVAKVQRQSLIRLLRKRVKGVRQIGVDAGMTLGAVMLDQLRHRMSRRCWRTE